MAGGIEHAPLLALTGELLALRSERIMANCWPAPLSLIVSPHAQDPNRPLFRKDFVHHAMLNIDAA